MLTNKSRLYLVLLALMAPTLIGMLVFDYYPKWETIKYSFYRWDGSTTVEFRWFRNYVEAFTTDPMFWQTFKLVGILLAANIVKMWPCILAAVVLHRLKSERWQYVYRVLFVIPMVIPGLVWMLIWKSFYDPTAGILNSILNGTGLMGVLQWMDSAMPSLAAATTPIRVAGVESVFGSLWGLALFGALLLMAKAGLRTSGKRWLWWLLLLGLGYFLWGPLRTVVATAVLLGCGWWAGREGIGRAVLKWSGVSAIAVAGVFVLTSMIWTDRTGVFDAGTPPWLGSEKLIIPSILFWGFPWIGTIGVLIYLSGLQNISADIYEAAELDGVGAWGKLFSIELPLILTQVRINLIFMTIGTLNDYGMFLVLLGPSGGPGNKGMVPGLYMYSEAFVNGRFGYACALGMVMFVMILAITIAYQKYVKVDK